MPGTAETENLVQIESFEGFVGIFGGHCAVGKYIDKPSVAIRVFDIKRCNLALGANTFTHRL